jgi:hypothetical protein
MESVILQKALRNVGIIITIYMKACGIHMHGFAFEAKYITGFIRYSLALRGNAQVK